MTSKPKPRAVKPRLIRSLTVIIETKTLNSFIEKVSNYAQSNPGLKCYRGQRDSSWANIPSLFRPKLKGLAENEKRAVRDLISVHPAEFGADSTMFEKLVRMQHFGLSTRLMDVSLNPLVALYFATDPGPKDDASDGQVTAFSVPEGREKYFDSDAVSCLANLSNLTEAEKQEIIGLRGTGGFGSSKADRDRINEEEVYKRLHQFIRVEKPYFLPIIKPIDLFKPYYVHPKLSNRRILSQSGAFIIHGLKPTKSIRYAEQIIETQFRIPEPDKGGVREALQLLGITDSTLFPELDRAAKRIESQYAGA